MNGGLKMKKIHVNVCNHPACYREAARLFKELNTVLGATLREQITLTGGPCRQTCTQAGMRTAPCVQIDGLQLTRATAGEVKQAVRQALEPCRMVA